MHLLRTPLERWQVFVPILLLGPALFLAAGGVTWSSNVQATTRVELFVPALPGHPPKRLVDEIVSNLTGELQRTRIGWDAVKLFLGEKEFTTDSFLWQDRQDRLQKAATRIRRQHGEASTRVLQDALRDGLVFDLPPRLKSETDGAVMAVDVALTNASSEIAVELNWAVTEALVHTFRRNLARHFETARSQAARELRRRRGTAGAAAAEAELERLDNIIVRAQNSTSYASLKAAEEAVILETGSTASSLLLICGASFLLALAAAWVAQSTDSSLRDPKRLAQAVGLPLTSSIPQVPGGERGLIPVGLLPAPAMESFHALASFTQTLRNEQEVRSLALTGALVGEGRSTVCCHLGVALATKGLRVLLVDASLNHPTLHALLGLPNRGGLRQVLRQVHDGSGDANARLSDVESMLQAAIQTTSLQNLSLLTAGESAGLGKLSLQRAWMRPLMLRLSRLADVVICDTPALTESLLGLDFAAAADRTLFVADAIKARRAPAVRARDLVLTVQGNFAGVVVNRVDAQYIQPTSPDPRRRVHSMETPILHQVGA